MCTIIKSFETPIKVKGYKVAIEMDGKFYSPSTGIEYKVGKVPIFTKSDDDKKPLFFNNFADSPLLVDGTKAMWYDIRHEGYTQIFKFIFDSKALCKYIIKRSVKFHYNVEKIGDDFSVVILKLSGDAKYEGKYSDGITYLIDEIKSLKLLHTITNKNYKFLKI